MYSLIIKQPLSVYKTNQLDYIFIWNHKNYFSVRTLTVLILKPNLTQMCSNRPLAIVCNDPSAGSPTDTLLRLLLPLNDTIWGNSNSDKINHHQTPYYSLNHSIGNSDGRCVQRPETYSMPVDDRRLLGIPRSWRIIANVNPQHDKVLKISQSSRIRGRFFLLGCPNTKNLQ